VGTAAIDCFRALADVRTWAPLVVAQMRRLGVDSVPIAMFIAVFTGIVLALLSSYTFTGAANIAAELGTMRVTEQVDALETLAYDTNAFLVVPRVLAGGIMFPVVTAFAVAVGVVSGWITAVNLLDLSTPEFFKGLRLFYEFKDVWFGLVKAGSFGLAVTLMGCLQGLRARGGAQGVGRAATRAVVLGCESILVLDAFWAIVLL
jgi:phospholipid/cholesterol/gamma-HCH transport system permease protein